MTYNKYGAKKITEKQFQGQVEQMAKIFGWKYYHTWNSRHSAPGYPDMTMIRVTPAQGCRVIFAELKTEKGKLTEPQKEWIEILQMSQNEVYVWRPSNLDEIEEILR